VLERILPSDVAVVSTCADFPEAALYPEEEAAVGRAVEKRRREFVTARACARGALAQLGLSPQAIPAGTRGEPLWPEGVVGSITHCEGYRACAAAPSAAHSTIGVDAEVNEALPEGVLEDIALSGERKWVRQLTGDQPAVHWDRLLFSIKESVYKAWFPLAESWLGFEDAAVSIDRERRSFFARLLVPGPDVEGRELDGFSGRWLADDRLLLAAIVLPRAAPMRQAGLGQARVMDEDWAQRR
jgi:4'-phosphopantetheinyl transferase EntD